MDNQEFENVVAPEIEEQPKKKDRRWLIVLIAIILCFVIAIVGTAIWVTAYIKGEFKVNYNDLTSTDLGIEEVKEEKIINIALFGIDSTSEKSFKGRSDTIMILSVNTKTNTIKLISVMRDSFVPIVKDGKTSYNKINNAYASGGPELAIKTLNTVFDLDISEYATVNLFSIADIIDAVGGVEIEVVKNELLYINAGVSSQCSKLGIDDEPYMLKSAGKQHLNGIQAASYARIRKTSNAEGTSDDYGRTDRQRYVLEQMFNKVKILEWNQMLELAKVIAPMCETSISFTDAIDIAKDILLEKPQFFESRIPSQGYLMSKPDAKVGSVVYYDLNFAAKLIHSFIYNDVTPEQYISLKGIEKRDWYSLGFERPKIDADSLPKKEDVVSSTNESTVE
jgi:LCP family protein required for cell wall assembly